MAVRTLAWIAATTVAPGCGASTADLLAVPAQDNVPETIYVDPANALLMVNSVVNDFECAFGGFVVAEGLASDELHEGGIGNSGWPLDRRDNGATGAIYGTAGCTSTSGVYTPLSTARAAADKAIGRLAAWTDAQVPNRQLLIAQANLYAGFSYATLGMAMCQAAFDLGPLVDQKGMFALAEQRFTDAISAAQAASQLNLLNAAYLGRARVRLFQHDVAGAIADAQLVPKGFAFNATMDATNPRRFNHLFQAISTARNVTVDVATRTLSTELGELDPRAATTKLTPTTADGLGQLYTPTKYSAATAAAGQAIPMPIARYEEAQLILAEAQGGTTAITVVNALRAAAKLKPYAGATDAAAIRALIAGERQRALFVEGFRAFDVERFTLPLLPAVGTAYEKGGTYGGTVCLPLPDAERLANPNIVASQLISGVQGQFPPP